MACHRSVARPARRARAAGCAARAPSPGRSASSAIGVVHAAADRCASGAARHSARPCRAPGPRSRARARTYVPPLHVISTSSQSSPRDRAPAIRARAWRRAAAPRPRRVAPWRRRAARRRAWPRRPAAPARALPVSAASAASSRDQSGAVPCRTGAPVEIIGVGGDAEGDARAIHLGFAVDVREQPRGLPHRAHEQVRSRTDRACPRARPVCVRSARRTRATTSCDVMPAGLSTSSSPSWSPVGADGPSSCAGSGSRQERCAAQLPRSPAASSDGAALRRRPTATPRHCAASHGAPARAAARCARHGRCSRRP